LKGVQWTLTVAILIFLIVQLNEIGWVDILKSLPTNPLFYLLFLLRFLSLPISEQFIYRLSLKFTFWEGFKVFMIKKILNTDVVAYSGEAYMFAYGKKKWKISDKYLFNVVKDNNIISAFTSTMTGVAILIVLIYFGQVNFLEFITISTTAIVGIIVFILAILFLALFYRKKVIAFDTPTTVKIFSIHQVRLILVYALDLLQYVVALPLVPLDIWFTFVAIQIIYSRIPFLPSQDILLLGIYAKVSEMYDVSQAEIMAVFLMIYALTRLLNLVLYAWFSLGNRVSGIEKE